MAIQKVGREQLNLSWELSFERLEGYVRLALESSKQEEASTNAYYALMMALHWLEITKLGCETICRTGLLDAKLKTVILSPAPQTNEERPRSELG